MTCRIISNYHTWADSAVRSFIPIFLSSKLRQMQVFPQQITSCLMARVQTQAGFHGASWGRAMNTTPQRERKNTMEAQRTHKLPTQLGSRAGNENWSQHALPVSELMKRLLWCANTEISLSPFFHHPNSEWSTLPMSLIVYSSFLSNHVQPGFLPSSPLMAAHFSRPPITTLSQIWQPSFRSLLLVLFTFWASLFLGLWFSSTFFFPSQSYVHSPRPSRLLIMGKLTKSDGSCSTSPDAPF